MPHTADEVTTGSGGTGRGSPEQQKAAEKERQEVRALLKEYNGARGFDKGARARYARDRRYAAGKANPNWAVDANMIGTFIDILVSFLYAKDPDVSARPGEQVGKQPDSDNINFAKTVQLVVSRLWKKGRLKRKVRKQVRSSLSVGPGWLKVIMSDEKRRDPIVQKDLNDLQDNLMRLRALRDEIRNEEGDLSDEEIDNKIAEQKRQQAALETKLEVVVRRGLAIDFVRAEDMQVSLDVSELSDHLDADWNGNQMFMQKDQVLGLFNRLSAKDIASVKIFYQRQDTDVHGHHGHAAGESAAGITAHDAEKFTSDSPTTSGDEGSIKFVRVVEIWDKRDNHIKTVIDGVSRWAREPYQPKYATSRFYPYFNLSLFEVDGERHPQSLSSRLAKLQDEYASTRSNGRLARSRSIPGVIFDAGKITPDDIRKIEEAVEQEYVGINPVAGDDLSKQFTAKPVGRYDPRIYDTGPSVRDMERMSGVQEAQSQAITTPKTATEASIEQQGFASRTGADRDTEEDMLTDLAEYTTELSIQALDLKTVRRIAGPLAFWPEGMDFEDIVTLVEVEVEGGTTGRPNKEADRQTWSTLLPLIRETMVIIQQAFAEGNQPLAEALMQLLIETAQRIDDRVDLKRFITPLSQTPAGAVPAGGGGSGAPGSPSPPKPAAAPAGSAPPIQ